jgi:hypothetical protein
VVWEGRRGDSPPYPDVCRALFNILEVKVLFTS